MRRSYRRRHWSQIEAREQISAYEPSTSDDAERYDRWLDEIAEHDRRLLCSELEHMSRNRHD